jgi:hypothetical protein
MTTTPPDSGGITGRQTPAQVTPRDTRPGLAPLPREHPGPANRPLRAPARAGTGPSLPHGGGGATTVTHRHHQDGASSMTATGLRLAPDLDDELTTALAHAEELLLEVLALEDDDPGATWPAPLAGQQALTALRRIWDAVAPTQGERAAAAGHTGRLLAPDGTYEHAPLRLAAVDQDDVAVLAAAAAVFADPRAPGDVRTALEHGADIAYGADDDQACTRLVMAVARLAELLALPPDRDTEILTALIQAAAPGQDIVLSADGEAAYQRYATRANRAWTGGNPLTRYLY